MATAATPPELTPEQQAALSTRDCSVALSAGAGCGKTFVLTERFLSHLEYTPDTDASAQLGKLIAITFTDRAAREMRDRIRKQVRERLRTAAAGPEADHWLQILRRLDGAKISTIHSFCGALLRAHAVEAGLDPQFGLLEPVQADTLLGELIDDRLRELLAAHDQSMIDLTAAYDLSGVREKVRTLVDERFALRFEEWLDHTPEQLAELWGRYHAEHVRPQMLAAFLESPLVVGLRQFIADERGVPHPLSARADDVEDVCAALAKKSESTKPRSPADSAAEDALFDKLKESAKVQGATGKKAWEGREEVYERFKTDFAAIRKQVEGLKANGTFDVVAARATAEAALRLTAMAAPIRAAYEAEKKQLNVLDFDDLLIRARNLLCAPEHARLRKNFSRGIELLLVDECQDTDALQVELIQALVDGKLAEGKLFFVGDFKQSIYRFRGAEPKVFNDLQQEVPPRGRLPLSLNFRSQPAILDFVNALFSGYFGARYEPLGAKREQHTPTPAIEFLWTSAGGAAGGAAGKDDAAREPASDGTVPDSAKTPTASAGDDQVDELNADALRRLEADWIARRLRQMFDAAEPILPAKGKHGGLPLRKPEYGDVAILFRAMSNVAIYEAALEQYGIPYYVVGGKAFYSQQEVYDLLNFLRVLDSVCDDVALAGVLRSPFFALDDETLFLLAEHGSRDNGDGLAAALFAPALADELQQALGWERCRRVKFASRTLSELRAMKNRLPITDLLNEILARTAYDAVLTAEFLGQRKLANLRKLLAQARSFDRSGIFTLTEFIAQLSTSVADMPDEALAATYAEGANVVRLMSIHQSKGLEFPIVVVPDLERKKQADRSSIAFARELGPMVKPPYGDDLPSGLDLYKLMEKEQSEAESKRLLYVAVTRAADYLILSSGVDDPAEPKEEWRKFLGGRFDLQIGAFLGTLLKDARRPEVRVTLTRPELPKQEHERAARVDWPATLKLAQTQADAGRAALRPGTAAVEPRLASRRRFSFTRLTGHLIPVDGPDADHDDVEAATTLDAAAGATLGTLVHGVLATVDFRKFAGGAARGELERHVRRQARLLNAEDDGSVRSASEMVEAFLRSPRAKEVAAAKQIHRETEFLLRPPSDSSATTKKSKAGTGGLTAPRSPQSEEIGDDVYLQGFIDLLYEDSVGQWHLVDYKTHQLAAHDPAAAAAPYASQLAIYALAVEKILGRVPEELALYFLRTGGEHSLAWSDAVRTKAIDDVNLALRKSLLSEGPKPKPDAAAKKPRVKSGTKSGR